LNATTLIAEIVEVDQEVVSAKFHVETRQRMRAKRLKIEKMQSEGNVSKAEALQTDLMESTMEAEAAALHLQALKRTQALRKEAARLRSAGDEAEAQLKDMEVEAAAADAVKQARQISVMQRGREAWKQLAREKPGTLVNSDTELDLDVDVSADFDAQWDAGVDASGLRPQSPSRGHAARNADHSLDNGGDGSGVKSNASEESLVHAKVKRKSALKKDGVGHADGNAAAVDTLKIKPKKVEVLSGSDSEAAVRASPKAKGKAKSKVKAKAKHKGHGAEHPKEEPAAGENDQDVDIAQAILLQEASDLQSKSLARSKGLRIEAEELRAQGRVDEAELKEQRAVKADEAAADATQQLETMRRASLQYNKALGKDTTEVVVDRDGTNDTNGSDSTIEMNVLGLRELELCFPGINYDDVDQATFVAELFAHFRACGVSEETIGKLSVDLRHS